MRALKLAFTYIIFFTSTLLLTTSCQLFKKDTQLDNKPIVEFLSSYKRQQATPQEKQKADSIGQLVLQRENTLKNRELLATYIQHVSPDLPYIDELETRSKKHNDLTHLGLSHFYRAKHFEKTFSKDSSLYNYTKAEMLFRHTNDTLNLSQTLTFKGIVLVNNRIFEEAETTIIQAMSLTNHVKNSNLLYTQNLMLGATFSGLGQYDKAEQQIQKAIAYLNSPESDAAYPPYLKQLNLLSAQNSLTRNYLESKEFNKAYDLIEQVQSNAAIQDQKNYYEQIIYAISLQSLANINLQVNKLKNIEKDIKQSIFLLNKNNAQDEEQFSQIILAKYFLKTNQKQKAIDLLQNIISHAKQEKLLFQEKQALAVLLQATSDNTSEIFNRFQQITDLISQDANSMHNTFARIKLETDDLLKENRTLAKQKRWITTTSLFVLLMTSLLFSFFFVRQKNKQLKTVELLQKDTEKYYDSILQIQSELSQARNLERKKIGQDLHDGIMNKIFITRFLLEQMSNEDFQTKKQDLVKEFQEIEKNIRNVSHVLAKDNVFSTNSFCSLLSDLVDLQNRNNKTQFTFEIQNGVDLEKLDTKAKIHIYRIVQEALQNVQKYAKATKSEVCFKESDNKIALSITDNGIGFEVGQNTTGIGLSNIRARASFIKAQCEIQSAPGKGTRIQILFGDLT
ncbi:tetratricopeptide repeat-containing sensor histidine kinase [Myroides sp. LJL119]